MYIHYIMLNRQKNYNFIPAHKLFRFTDARIIAFSTNHTTSWVLVVRLALYYEKCRSIFRSTLPSLKVGILPTKLPNSRFSDSRRHAIPMENG